MPSKEERFLGCFLGGAVGDALGAPVEFMGLNAILQRYGPAGICDFSSMPVAQITDDTQMTLFTAEGLIRAQNSMREKGICSCPSVVYHAYLRWLYTQDRSVLPKHPGRNGWPDGWLVSVQELHSLRAPGTTCLKALRSGRMGTLEAPPNDSKGCGGVMRMAPVGLIAQDPFQLGCELAVITHGHPSGYLAAGCLAKIIAGVNRGDPIADAVQAALADLKKHPQHEGCAAAIERAVALAAAARGVPEEVERLGAGWVAEEALAISVFCALVAKDFASGVILAVNHSGDSDSTGSITGNILGTALGERGIPEAWLAKLELRDEISALALDLKRLCEGEVAEAECAAWWAKYPGW